MGRPQTDKRSRLIQSAMNLAHRQGFNQTTLADIAQEADVPLGNVYYYFKTKEAIGAALITQRADDFQALRETWNGMGDPRQRLEAFVQMTVDNRQQLMRSGCPIGTLCEELRKSGGGLANDAARLFTGFIDWLEAQFLALGKGAQSRDCAEHLLVVLEGATLMTHSFHDTGYIEREAERLKAWIAAL